MIWKKREGFTRKKPGGSGGRQAARNTGPVIRIAITNRCERLVMAQLLTDARPRIKTASPIA
jgi:hypothetical protein